MAQGQLNGKVAIVTGGSAGIGRAIVTLFLEHGAKVASLDISTPAASENASELAVKCNVSSESDVNNAVSEVLEHWGAVDILVNCAGVVDEYGIVARPINPSQVALYNFTDGHTQARVGDVTNKTWERCMAINVTGPMYLIRRCLPELLKAEPKGAIVNICSVAAVRGSVAGVAYTASKHALLGVSRTTAWAYAKTGLRCNALLPGGVGGTDVLKGSDPGMFQSEGGVVTAPYQACMPGLCKPADIANAVLFLVTAPAVNGAELAVDQGWTVA